MTHVAAEMRSEQSTLSVTVLSQLCLSQSFLYIFVSIFYHHRTFLLYIQHFCYTYNHQSGLADEGLPHNTSSSTTPNASHPCNCLCSAANRTSSSAADTVAASTNVCPEDTPHNCTGLHDTTDAHACCVCCCAYCCSVYCCASSCCCSCCWASMSASRAALSLDRKRSCWASAWGCVEGGCGCGCGCVGWVCGRWADHVGGCTHKVLLSSCTQHTSCTAMRCFCTTVSSAAHVVCN